MAEFTPQRSKTVGFLLCKCPRCGKSDVFKYSIFNFRRFADTKLECEICKLNYQPEPGFFFGAMYWSYAIIVAIIISFSVAFSIFHIFDYAIYAIPIFIILALPVIFRYSRMLMLYVIYPMMYKEKYNH
jgi:uncharacterized protein (DUF983 family)